MDCSLPGSSIHGIFQARVLEWVAISFSRGSSRPTGSNPGLSHCRQMLYHLSRYGSPIKHLAHSKWFRYVTSLLHLVQRFSTGGDFATQGTFGNSWRHSWLTEPGEWSPKSVSWVWVLALPLSAWVTWEINLLILKPLSPFMALKEDSLVKFMWTSAVQCFTSITCNSLLCLLGAASQRRPRLELLLYGSKLPARGRWIHTYWTSVMWVFCIQHFKPIV